MYKRTIGAALVAVLAFALVVSACGGGSDSTASGDSTSEASESSGGSAPTKAVFIKEADEICGDANEALNEELGEYAKENGIELGKEEPSEAQQIELFEAIALPNIKRQGEELAALTPPEGDEEAIEEITDSLASGVEEAEADPQSVTEENGPLADASQKAKAYGLKTCGQ